MGVEKYYGLCTHAAKNIASSNVPLSLFPSIIMQLAPTHRGWCVGVNNHVYLFVQANRYSQYSLYRAPNEQTVKFSGELENVEIRKPRVGG
jgi:hypothetical protein